MPGCTVVQWLTCFEDSKWNWKVSLLGKEWFIISRDSMPLIQISSTIQLVSTKTPLLEAKSQLFQWCNQRLGEFQIFNVLKVCINRSFCSWSDFWKLFECFYKIWSDLYRCIGPPRGSSFKLKINFFEVAPYNYLVHFHVMFLLSLISLFKYADVVSYNLVNISSSEEFYI